MLNHSFRIGFNLLVKKWSGALLSGFSTYGLLLLAQPPRHVPEAAYFFLLPALVWFSRKPDLKKVALTFLVCGWFYHIALVGWMRHVTFGGMLMASFLMSLYQLPWFLVARTWLPVAIGFSFPRRVLLILGLSSCWVMIEWMRCQFTLGFPWCPLSVTQWERPAILQTVPILGAWGVSFFLIVFNLCLASYLHHLLVRRREKEGFSLSSFCPDFYFGLLVFILMVLPFFENRRKAVSNEAQRVLKVGVCQPYLRDKWKENRVLEHKETLVRQTKFLSLLNPDLIVWPEASTPYAVNLDRQWVENLAKDANCTLLIGAVVKEGDFSYNTISEVSPDSGLNPERYDKQVLVPFGEYVPYPFRWIPGLSKMVGPVGNFTSGDRPHIFQIRAKDRKEAVRVGPLICYEDIFPFLSRDIVSQEVDFLFVSTNDAWFEREGCAEQHAAHSILRALELGRPFLRCGNAGWSGWIDARGIVREVLENEEGSIYFEGAGLFELLLPERNRTLYVRYGDYFLIACLSLFSLSYLIKCKRIDLGEEYG
jgi:apolipoprotein N-acyltransferase